jgi:acyl carrier protein phosphodiesterase
MPRYTRDMQRQLVNSLLRAASAARFELHAIDDGGGKAVPVTTEDEALDIVFSVSDSFVFFRRYGKRHWLRIIPDNGSDMFIDYSDDGGPDAANPWPNTFASLIAQVQADDVRRQLTLRQAQEHLRGVGMTLVKRDNELVVKFAGTSNDAPANYFTNDLDDAVRTGLDMAARAAAPVVPHALFNVWSPDEVAECVEGVPPELSRKLWELVPVSDKARSEVPDDFSDFCLARTWSKLTPDEQTQLNALADAHEKR